MRKALVKRGGQIIEVMVDENTFKKGGSNMIKRKDGSYSQRGLWDNIRANKGSGKQPTKQMLEQAKKIKRNKKQMGGEELYGNYMLPEFEVEENTGMYNPNIVGPSAPRYIPSETGFVPNPYYTTGSGSAESFPLEMFAAPMMRGASSLAGMLSPNAMKTILGVGAASSLEGCAPGKDCRGLRSHPGYKKSWGKSKKRRRQEGGEEDFYTPDTGIEQYAPDQSWYEGNPNTSAPGNIVSWPSYPREEGMSMNEMPTQAMPQRNSPSTGSIYLGTGRYSGLSSNPMISLNNDYSIYQEDMPEYRRGFDLFNRIGQGFNNMGETMGDGFDNLGDFFQRMKKNRKKARRDRRRGRRGNGLLNLLKGKRGNGLKSCESGIDCFKFQEGGEESDQMDQILDQIEDALEQGAKPEEVLQQLIQMGIEQEQAQMLIQEAIQDLQEDATENELPEAQTGGQGSWMQDPYGSNSLDDVLRTKVFPAGLATILAGAIPAYFIRRKEKRLEREEQERLEKENEETPTKAFGGNTDMFADGGSYRVYKTSERKGKTHKVVGPGGVTKYFGDPNLGERSKSKYGKKGFYARHKKNLAKNPFFRAYARATWAEGGEPSFMQTPDFKTNSFIDLVRQEAESNAYKNIMNQAQEMYMQMGGAQDYGYVGNPYASMYQQNIDDLNSKGNVEGAVFNAANNFGKKIGEGLQMAANIAAPGSGTLIKTMSSGDGLGSILKGIGSDPQALMGFFARKGGSLRKAQIGLEQFVPGYVSPYTTDPFTNQGISANLTLEEFVKKFEEQNPSYGKQVIPQQPQQYNVANQSLNTPALDQINYFDEQGNYTNFEGPLNQAKQPENLAEATNPIKDPLLKPPVQKSQFSFENGLDPLLTGASILTAMGNRGKAEKLKVSAPGTESDNVYAAVDQNQTNFGDFERNTGKLMKPYILGTDQGVPALARYGGGLKRAKQGGVQKDGMYLSYPTATPESVLYGEQPKKPSNTLQPVKREFANLEAEGGETAITPVGIDGVPKFWKIGGERHSNGGTPLNLPDGSFIFSDTKSMKLGGSILEELGIKGKKKKTPAEISKILGKGYEKFVMAIQDPNSDKIERRTAELMIENQIKKLGMLALAQESKKGFPDGIPMIAIPYMESVGIAPEQVLPKPQMGMEEMGMQQQMPMEQMPMQGMEMPMARYGLQKYQIAGQTDMLGMDPNAPFPTSSPTGPDDKNVAQYILGSLANYFTSTPEEEAPVPVGNLLATQEVYSPVKGFDSIEVLDKFISKGDYFGEDFNSLYKLYSGSLKAIDFARTELIQGAISLDEYEKRKEEINSRIDKIKTQITKSKDRIPFHESLGIIHNSTVDILENMEGILDQEKDKLNYRASDLRKFRKYQSNVSFLETEKQNIVKLLNSDIGDLERMEFKRRLIDVNDALNYETDKTTQFGEKAFKTNSESLNETDIENEFINISRLKNYDNDFFKEDFRKQYGRHGYRVYKYDNYIKDYESNPLTSNIKPSVETEQGSLNATEEVAPVVQDTVPVVAPPVTPPPTQSKTSETKSKTKKKNKITFGADDLEGIQIIQK